MLFDNLVGHEVYSGHRWRHRDRDAYTYILAGNGLFKAARSPLITAVLPIWYHKIAGLPPLTPECVVSPERISGLYLHTVLQDALREENQGRERMYELHLVVDGALNIGWRVIAPAQRASATRIIYEPCPSPGITPELHSAAGAICDLHSHHDMPAFFSETDDADEQGFRFYAVIGRLHGGDKPEIRVRLGIYGDFIPLPATVLFTDAGPFRDCLIPAGDVPAER